MDFDLCASDAMGTSPSKKNKRKTIPLQTVLDPQKQGGWVEMRDAVTDEFVFWHPEREQLVYPYRNNGEGQLCDKVKNIVVLLNIKYGSVIEQTSEESEEEDNVFSVPKKPSKFEKTRCKVIATFEDTVKIPDESKETLFHVKINQKNIDRVKQLMLDKEPLRFTYEDEELEDEHGRPLFIEWRGTKSVTRKDQEVLRGNFYFRKECRSQPMRLVRTMLEMAGKPEELWSTKSPRGNALRAASCLTTRLNGTVYRLGELFPADTRRIVVPKKKKKNKVANSEIVNDENELL